MLAIGAGYWLYARNAPLAVETATVSQAYPSQAHTLLNATYRDIEAAADVAIGTVSRVLNTPDVDGFRSNHLGGVHGLFADGHVAFMGEDTPAEILVAISTKDGGEPARALP